MKSCTRTSPAPVCARAGLVAAAPRPESIAPDRKTVAVLYFDNNTGRSDYDPLGKGIAAMMISDLGYDILLLHGTYQTGNIVDAGWLISYTALAVAALHPSMSMRQTVETLSGDIRFRTADAPRPAGTMALPGDAAAVATAPAEWAGVVAVIVVLLTKTTPVAPTPIKKNIKGIIGMPVNLFYGTGIPACILVLDKENAAARRPSSFSGPASPA
mgnify:CR=1 FL=1